MAKLTLSLTEKDVLTAKRLARERGTTVSAMFASFVRVVAMHNRPIVPRDLSPITRKMTGMITLPKGKSDRTLIEDAVTAKYGFPRRSRRQHRGG